MKTCESSSLSVRTFGWLAQLARASRLHREGHRFESCTTHKAWFIMLSCRGSQGSHGGALKKLRYRCDSCPRHLNRGSSLVVKRFLAKEKTAGSNPVSRSHLSLIMFFIAGSSNGRTAPFEGVYPGSSPGPAASLWSKRF